MRFEAAARMIHTSVVLAAANILNTVVVTPYLTVHLRYTALPAVSNRDFKTTGTVSLWRVAEPDRLLPAAALSVQTAKVGGQKTVIESLVKLKIENTSQWRARADVGSVRTTVAVLLKDLRKVADLIGGAVRGNGDL